MTSEHPQYSGGMAYPNEQFGRRMRVNAHAKTLLAGYVVEHCIKDGDCLAIDVGTTVTYLARELARSRRRAIRVATHSVSVPIELLGTQVLEDRIGCIVFPGHLQFADAALLPRDTRRIRDWPPFDGRPYKAILAAEGFSTRKGSTTSLQDIRRLNRRYIEEAKEVILLADHSKFLIEAGLTVTMCGLGPDDRWLKRSIPFRLVTDTLWELGGQPPEEFEKLCNHASVKKRRPNSPYDNVVVFESELYPNLKRS